MINLQNKQAAHVAQYQKNKQPIYIFRGNLIHLKLMCLPLINLRRIYLQVLLVERMKTISYLK